MITLRSKGRQVECFPEFYKQKKIKDYEEVFRIVSRSISCYVLCPDSRCN